MLTILNVAGRGDPITIRRCAEVAHAEIKRLPTRSACELALRILWRWGISTIPPDALPYMIGSYTMDTTRLQQFLGPDYPEIMRFSVEDALRDSFSR
jgi:hypothetical protein